MRPRSTATLFIGALLFLPPVLLICAATSQWLFWPILVLFLVWVGRVIVAVRREARQRRERIAKILAQKPSYVAYGSGTPRWLAVPIYFVFTVAAFVLILWQTMIHPAHLTGFIGFLNAMRLSCLLPFAVLAATATFKAVAWHLRSTYPDKVLAFANEEGIGTSDGWVIPYAKIRRIDPCCLRSRIGSDNWIELADDRCPRRVPVNMSVETPDEILQQLRDHALAAGAKLAPALPNGRPPSGGSQLGYRMGY